MQKKRAIALIAALSVCMSVTVPAFADEYTAEAPAAVVADDVQLEDTAEEPSADDVVYAEPAENTETTEETPAEVPAEEEAPAEETPAEDTTPAEEVPAEEEAPAEETPAEDATPAEENPADETPAEDATPAEETPAEEAAPVEDAAPAEEVPVFDETTPAEEASVDLDLDKLEETAEEEIVDEEELDLFAAVPSAPAVRATAGNGSVTLSWNKIYDATSYRIYVYFPSTGRYAHLATLEGSSVTTFTINNLNNGSRYAFLVRAFNGSTGSYYSSYDVVYATPSAPLARPSVTATAGNGYATLSWNPVSGATSYRIYVYFPSTGKYVHMATTSATYYTRYNMQNGARVGFLVRAFNGNTGSAYTSADVKYVTPFGSLAKPSVTATAGNGYATLRWAAVSGATSYRIYVYFPSTGRYVHLDTTTGTSYTRYNMQNGAKVGFLVRAFNGSIGSSYSTADVKYVTPYSSLARPSVTATAGNGQITLRWSAVSGATSYRIYRYYPSTGTYSHLLTTTRTDYVMSGLSNGTRYGYLVRAFNGNTGSAYSSANVVYATPGGTLSRPYPTATAGNGYVTLRWNSITNATYYKIYRYVNGSYNELGTSYGNTYTVYNLSNGTRYGFLVRAFNSSNASNYSSADVVYCTPTGGTLSKPVVTITSGTNSAYLRWNTVSGATYYRIYEYTGGSYREITSTYATSYTVTGLVNGYRYGFQVRAFNDYGSSSNYTSSDVYYVTIGSGTLATPTMSGAANGQSGAYLSWTPVNGATTYYVYKVVNGSYTSLGSTYNTSVNIANLTPGYTYGFAVRAYSNGSYSNYSNIVYITPSNYYY